MSIAQADPAASAPAMLRLFLALWPDEDVRNALVQLQDAVTGRRTGYANLHLTLQFLGQQPASVLPELKALLERVPPVSIALRIDRIGYFPRSGVAWAGTHRTPEALLDLQRSLAASLRESGIAFDDRPFRPHLTLARSALAPQDLAFEPISWQASHLVLVRSVTRPSGSAYEILASRDLAHAARTRDEAGTDVPGASMN